MTRGGRRTAQDGPERRCIATGESGGTERLIRFVLGPDGAVVPDLAARLPGRGVWLTADRALVERAVAKRLFARAFRAPAAVPEGLADLLERLLAERVVSFIALARKAGLAVTGFEKTRGWLAGGRAAVLLEAADGAAEGRARLARMAPDLPRVAVLLAGELGLAFGRDFAIHAALGAGSVAERVVQEAGRLAGLRAGARGPADDDRARSGSPASAASGMDDRTGAEGGPEQDCE